MKKILSISALLLAFTLGVHAQEKKSWDFTKGLSDETIANLNADATNWGSNGTDSAGNTNNWKNLTKQNASNYWTANGEVIEELRGLKIDIGSKKDNSVHLATTKLRLTRASTKITFPKLANGQKITVVGRSANGTATNRGIAPVQSYLQFQAEESSPQYNGACIFLGNQVEGSEGTYTFVWKVVTEGTDSVDVQFQLTPDGGIDFTLFMIDQGDAPEVQEAKPVGYLYAGDLDSDFANAYLDGSETFKLTNIDVTSTEATVDSLRSFAGLVISPTIPADNAYLSTIKQAIAYVPVLNLNTAIYETLGYGKAVKTEATTLTVKDTKSDVFADFDIENGLELLTEGGITGVELGDYFAKDDTLAMAGDKVAMHIHNAKRNAYLLLPLSLEDLLVADQNVIATLIPQALQVVVETKKAIQTVGTPVITTKQNDGSTDVTITAANSKAIYYTLDGTEPTTASTLYTAPFTLTDSLTVKAFATGDGYTDSKIAEKKIAIATKAVAPSIAIAREAGKSTVTLTCEEGTQAYFNFTRSAKQEESQKCDTLITITEPTYITFFAIGEGKLQSDATTTFVGIDGIDKTNIRWDILAHMGAEKEEWGEVGNEDSRSNKVNYMFGKTAQSMYTDEIESQDVVKDSLGNIIKSQIDPEADSILVTYKKVEQMVVPNVSNTWKVTSYGQVMTWENPTPGKNVGSAGSNCPELAADHMFVNDSIGVTNYMLNFKGKQSGEPYNATIQTAEAYQGPFDIIVYFNNGSAGSYPKVDVEYSLDEQTWVKIDTLETRDVRLMKRNKLSYEGTDKVFVRLAHKGGNSAGQVFDIYLMGNGEKSQAYSEETVGIQTVQPEGAVVRTEVFTLGGNRTAHAGRGMQIIRKTYANGAVVTKKVIR